MTPTTRQEAVIAHPLTPLVVAAPPGCGKTEALAWRLAQLVQTRAVTPPRKALGVTFSNRAKRNLASRVSLALGHSWRDHATVTNFHGLAARLVAAHGTRVGVPREAVFPTRAWLKATERKAGFNRGNEEALREMLRTAKSDGASEREVQDKLASDSAPECVAFERLRREQGRLDYHDLIRHAIRLLRDPLVQRLYAEHFGAIVVDEVQDLTRDQLEFVTLLGTDKTTFAGDRSQAIYGFAGADADHTFNVLSSIPSVTEIKLDVSYRSSPAVLAAVNTIAPIVGGQSLRCADPSEWANGGVTAVLSTGDWATEARTVCSRVSQLISNRPDSTIGLISRRSSRLSNLRSALQTSSLPVQDWSSASDVPEVAQLLHRTFAGLGRGAQSDTARLDELRRRSFAAAERLDIETWDRLEEALEDLADRVRNGDTLAEAIRGSRQSQDPDKPVSPGVHLLNGHIGKGQEFDWVFVVGMEDGHIPDFRANTPQEIADELRILLVMASRARYGLVLTYSGTAETRAGPRPQRRSRWLATLTPAIQHQW